MHPTPLALIVGVIAAFVVSGVGWRLGALTVSGFVAASCVGGVVMGPGGLPFAAPMVVFFVTASAWSRWRTRDSSTTATPRTATQVFANGGAAAAIVLASALVSPKSGPAPRDWFLLYLAAVGFACADTWATEIGSKVAKKAWLVTSWTMVPAGQSGGVTIAGTLAAAAGASLIAATGWAFWAMGSRELQWRMDAAEALAVIWAALIATLFDSILGAGLQGQYRCARCQRVVEERFHCELPASRMRGTRWIGNNAVNFIASAASVACAWYLLSSFAWQI